MSSFFLLGGLPSCFGWSTMRASAVSFLGPKLFLASSCVLEFPLIQAEALYLLVFLLVFSL
jgi:hypothetical protein